MNILSSKRLARRIWFLFLFTTSVLILQGFYNIFSLNKVDSSITTVYSSVNQIRETASQITRPISELRQLSMSLVMAPNRAYKKKYKESILAYQKKIDIEFDNLMSLELLDSESMKLLNGIRLVWTEYSKQVEKTYTFDDKGKRIEVFLSVMTNEKEAYDRVMTSIKEFNTYQYEKGLEIYNNAQKDSIIAFWAVVATTAIEALLLKVILSYVLRLITAYVRGKKEHETELIRINQEMGESQIKAEAANFAKSKFLANMSHEIRTPMNAVLGYAQLMERDPKLTSLQSDYLKIINRSGEHLLHLINDILDMSKIEAGRIVLNRETFDFHALLDDIEILFRSQITRKNLGFNFSRARNVPRNVNADGGKVRQVLLNLIGNAIKFTDKGRIQVKVKMRDVTFPKTVIFPESQDREAFPGKEQCRIVVEVEDTGLGIDAKDLNKIFETFEQVTNIEQSKAGTGLGMAISRKFAQMMGGDLTVTSKIGIGSVFYFEFVGEQDIEKNPGLSA